jgi:hypothetical protein
MAHEREYTYTHTHTYIYITKCTGFLGVFAEQTWGIVWPLEATMVDQDLIANSK